MLLYISRHLCVLSFSYHLCLKYFCSKEMKNVHKCCYCMENAIAGTLLKNKSTLINKCIKGM